MKTQGFICSKGIFVELFSGKHITNGGKGLKTFFFSSEGKQQRGLGFMIKRWTSPSGNQFTISKKKNNNNKQTNK